MNSLICSKSLKQWQLSKLLRKKFEVIFTLYVGKTLSIQLLADFFVISDMLRATPKFPLTFISCYSTSLSFLWHSYLVTPHISLCSKLSMLWIDNIRRKYLGGNLRVAPIWEKANVAWYGFGVCLEDQTKPHVQIEWSAASTSIKFSVNLGFYFYLFYIFFFMEETIERSERNF